MIHLSGSYINLKSAVDRDFKLTTQIQNSNLLFNIIRHEGVYGKDFHHINHSISDGQLGCLLSHLQIIESNLNNDDYILIIEDDEFFDSRLNQILNILLELTDKNLDWDIIYLDATIVEIEDYLLLSRAIEANKLNNELSFFFRIPLSSTIYGTHAYIINNRSKIKFYNLIKSNYYNQPIDNIYCNAIRNNEIAAYISLPLLCGPSSLTLNSQISQSEHPLMKYWIDYRDSISHYKYNNLIEFNKDIELNMSIAITARLNFQPLLTFRPA